MNNTTIICKNRSTTYLHYYIEQILQLGKYKCKCIRKMKRVEKTLTVDIHCLPCASRSFYHNEMHIIRELQIRANKQMNKLH